MSFWDHTKWGNHLDPIHKSDLNNLIGKYGCSEQFKRKKERRAEEAFTGNHTESNSVNGKACSGNAVHMVMDNILRNPTTCMAALDPRLDFPRESIAKEYDRQFRIASQGKQVSWFKVSSEKHRNDQIDSLVGLLADLHNHIGKVLMVEAGFIYQLNGIWLTGMVDIVYCKPGSDKPSYADWKTGAQKPHQIELDHGWESGIYGGAMKHGHWIEGESVPVEPGIPHRDSMEAACIKLASALLDVDWFSRQMPLTGSEIASQTLDRIMMEYGVTRFNEFPEEIKLVHMRDYIPYTRATTRELKSRDDLKWFGLTAPEKHKFVKGDQRGPAWLHIDRREDDLPRLAHLLDAVVSWIRHGKFAAAPGELCTRCQFRVPCLNTGYGATGKELVKINTAMDTMGVEDFGGLDDL